MVRTTTRDDESQANASIATPDYRQTGVDLIDVNAGDRVTFTTTTRRTNGVRIGTPKTVTVDSVTVTEDESTEMVEVDPEWLPDSGMFGCDDDVVSATVPRDVTETNVTVVAIEDEYRYTLRQTDTGFVRVSSCKQADYVDQENGEWNAVARSNVTHGVLSSFEHEPVRTDGGKAPGEDVSIAPNYKTGGVWFTLGDKPRLLLSPDDARALAEEIESRPAFESYKDDPRYGMVDAVDKLREVAADVEDSVDDPDPDAFDPIPLTDGDTGGR